MTDEEELSVLELLETVPPAVKEYLLDQKTTNRRTEIYKAFKLTAEESDIAIYVEMAVFFGMVPLAEFPDTLYRSLPWPDSEEDKAAELAAEIMGQMMLPADPYLGDVSKVITGLGFDPAEYPAIEKIKLARQTYAQAASDTVGKAAIENLDHEARHRLEGVVESLLRGVRVPSGAIEAMTKPRKIGGAGLDDANAQVLVTLAQEIVGGTVLVDEEPNVEETASAPSATPLPPDAEKIRQIYAGTESERGLLEQRRQTLLADGQSDALAMRRKLKEVLQPTDIVEPEMWLVTAALFMVAESGDLLAAVTEDKWFQDMILKALHEQERGTDAELFKEKPEDPRFMNLFLQLVLRRYAGHSMADSARFGLRVINLLKKQGHPEYGSLTAFDMRDMRFRWLKPEII